MSEIITRLCAVEARMRAAGLPWMAARVSECIDRECVEPNIDELERVADMAEAQPRLEAENRQMREALEGLAESCTLRSLRGMDHVPSMRLQQEALGIARDTLASLPVQPSQSGNFGDLDGGAPNQFDPSKRGFQP